MPIATEERPISIRISDEEWANQAPSKETILDAMIALAEDGLVVLENAIDVKHIDALNEQMVKDAAELSSRPTTHYNSEGNMAQVPPIRPDLFFEDVFANPFAAPIIENMLGPNPEVRYLHGNTALRGTKRQDPHSDTQWRQWHWPFGIVANILTVEATKLNGSTEVWLGSHRETTVADRWGEVGDLSHKIKPELLEARRKIRPPIQPRIPKGSLVLRDLRLWHAGMPNSTDEPRCMMAILHNPAWFWSNLELTLPKNIKPILETFKSPVKYVGNFVPSEEFDHLSLEFHYDTSPYGGKRNEEEKAAWDEQWKNKWGHKF